MKVFAVMEVTIHEGTCMRQAFASEHLANQYMDVCTKNNIDEHIYFYVEEIKVLDELDSCY